MYASQLIAASAAVTLGLGTAHLWMMLFSDKLHPRDSSLEARMRSAPLVMTTRTSVWKAWFGFNASHSIGAILFGLLYGYFALEQFDLFARSAFLKGLGAATLLAYLLLALRYWFRAPLLGLTLAALLYSGGLVVLA